MRGRRKGGKRGRQEGGMRGRRKGGKRERHEGGKTGRWEKGKTGRRGEGKRKEAHVKNLREKEKAFSLFINFINSIDKYFLPLFTFHYTRKRSTFNLL